VVGIVVVALTAHGLPRAWAMSTDQLWGPPWEAAHLRWAGLLLLGGSVLAAVLRDSWAGRAARTAATASSIAGPGTPQSGTMWARTPRGEHVDEVEQRLDAALRELEQARADLARADEHLTLFAGQVSHELRTPLTAILANAEMLASEPPVAESEDLAWMVEGVARAAHRMNAMIEQMLTYARQGGEPSLGVTDLGSVFEAALEDLAPVVAEKQAVVKVEGLPRLAADRDQLYAVALNLLGNALKFSRPDASPRVDVRAERLGPVWRVTVTDNGIGVAPERREAMFVLFARADKRVEGNGLGLAAAKRVVDAHGGRIGMDEAEGGGTTVWFELPA
jgi:signal transduction histidine kinase